MPKLIDMLSLVFYAATGYLYYFCIENNWSDELRRLLEAAKIDGFGSFGGNFGIFIFHAHFTFQIFFYFTLYSYK